VTSITEDFAELLAPGVPALLAEIDGDLLAAVHAVARGDERDVGLSPLDRELVALAVAASPAVLDHEGIDRGLRRALDAGATPEQLSELLVLVSVLGLHTLTTGIPQLGALLAERGHPSVDGPLDARRVALKARREGDDPYWRRFEDDLPGFLGGLLRLAPEAYEQFFEFSALPWRSRALASRLKELLYVGIDATPGHVYVPGLRIHVANARALGASPGDVAAVLLVAARAGVGARRGDGATPG
jgi:alkylhydroperoxidase/carboxymuconolactone decarboxylase family protein YurZ